MKLRWFKHPDSYQVWSCLRSAYNGSKLQRLTLLDMPVCQNSFKRLLRLGSGRFLRLIDSIRKGDDDCPMDMRFVKKRFPDKLHSQKRQIVHDFLHHLYETLAEPMPEGTGASKRPRTVKKRQKKIDCYNTADWESSTTRVVLWVPSHAPKGPPDNDLQLQVVLLCSILSFLICYKCGWFGLLFFSCSGICFWYLYPA